MKLYYLETNSFWFLVKAKNKEFAKREVEKVTGKGSVDFIRTANHFEEQYFVNSGATKTLQRHNDPNI